MKNKFLTFFGFLFIFSFFVFSASADDLMDFDQDLLQSIEDELDQGKSAGEKVSEEGAFDFGQRLYEAKAYLMTRERKERGKWEHGAFVFEEFDQKEATIRARKSSVGLEGRVQAIEFNPIPYVKKQLRFMHVPTGSRLLLYYDYANVNSGSESVGKKKKKQGAIEFKIWVGRHLLKSLILSPRDGWKDVQIDLGRAAFLNGEVPITFEVSGEEFPGPFQFYARLVS